MALLNSILQHHKPPQWDERSYNNVRYVRIPLNEGSIEYNQIKSEFIQKFGHQDVVKIERVQHPFAFARFQIRKEHLRRQSATEPAETRQFFPITDESLIDKILEYNCDYRRRGCSYNSYSSLSSGDGYVVAVKTFSNHSFDTRDTHRFPEYIIQYGRRGRSVSSSSSSDIDYLVDRLRIY